MQFSCTKYASFFEKNIIAFLSYYLEYLYSRYILCFLPRNAQNTVGIRRPAHLQSVHLPICQFLLFNHLHWFLQGKVSFLWNVINYTSTLYPTNLKALYSDYLYCAYRMPHAKTMLSIIPVSIYKVFSQKLC